MDDHVTVPRRREHQGVATAPTSAPLAAAAVMIAACDLPLLTGSTVRSVIAALDGGEVAVAETDRAQPLCAAWRPLAATRLRAAFAAGERRLQAVLPLLKTRWVGVNHQELANHNAPGDLPH